MKPKLKELAVPSFSQYVDDNKIPNSKTYSLLSLFLFLIRENSCHFAKEERAVDVLIFKIIASTTLHRSIANTSSIHRLNLLYSNTVNVRMTFLIFEIQSFPLLTKKSINNANKNKKKTKTQYNKCFTYFNHISCR